MTHMDNNKKVFLAVILLTLGAIFVDFSGARIFGRSLDIKKGLDLAGGTKLVLQADMSAINQVDRTQALDSLKGIIERRVNLYGVSEPVIQTSKAGGDYRIIVELAGVSDVTQALNLIGQTAMLSFSELISATESAATNLTGKDLRKARADFDQNKGEPIISLTFSDEGAKKWEEITKKNLNKKIAILLDNQILLAPTVMSVISDGRTVISGGFTVAQTKEMAMLLNSGALPAPVKVIEQRTIGATLGQESINKSILAGVIGLGVVALFMVINYGVIGLLADIALLIYALLTLAIFKLIPVTLTLAGIAGFILSIGMAVDANILIFERMKEEIKWGRKRLEAIELGFHRALPSIKDSNANSLIICAILYWFGTGPVRGFAVTLAIGILVSLFTATTVTRQLLKLLK